MVLPNEYAGYYPEEEQIETIIDVAKPNDSGAMPAPNYQIAGPLADHQPNTAMRDAMASAGANIAGNVGEAALMGSDKAPAGSFFKKGLFGDFQFPWAASAGSAAPKLAAQLAGTGAAPASYMGGLTATGAAAPAAAGLGGAAAPGMMAALGPVGLGIGALMGLKALFGNKGGAVGPLSPQYKQGGGEMPDYDNDPLWVEWLHLYDDMNSGIIEPSHPRLVELETILQQKYPYPYTYKQGGNVQHKEHGGMMISPLSNNKSVKIENKETIEYKN